MSAYELTKTILKDSANLKAYYRFESGALTTDSSGNSRTLSAIGTPTEDASGQFGGAVVYSTNNAHSATDHADFKPTGSFSVGCWVKTSTNATSGVFQSRAQATSKEAGWALQQTTVSNSIGFQMGKNTGLTDGVDYSWCPASKNITDGIWHHVVGTWNGTTMRIYVDGKHENSVTGVGNAVYQATNYVRVGCLNSTGSNSNYFTGSVDDAFLLNGTALSADQIKELYEGRYIGEWMPQANLVGLWHLNGNSTDSSGNNNHGTDTAITYSSANGKMGTQGAGFNGSTSNISLADSSSLDITGNITCMFWAKFAALPANGADMSPFAKWNYGSSGQNSYAYYIYNDNGFYLLGSLQSANGTVFNNHSGPTAIPSLTTGVWHHYAISTDITSHASTFYCDGRSLGTDSDGTQTSIFNGNLAAKIGMYTDASGKFNGSIDEVAIFSRALTAAEIRKWYAWSVGKYM